MLALLAAAQHLAAYDAWAAIAAGAKSFLEPPADAASRRSSLFRNRYRVRSYEVDRGGRLRPVTLLNYLQDSAGNHAAELGFSVSQLRRRQVTWVISRHHVRFFRYPRRGEELAVRSQIRESGERAAFIHQLCSDRDGRELTRLRTVWRPAPGKEEPA